MKEERRRQKQLEANFEEEYFEDHGGGRATQALVNYVSFFICVCCLYYLVCKDTRGNMLPLVWTVMFFF